MDVVTTQLCAVSVAVVVDAELPGSPANDMRQTGERFASQPPDRVDEILRPLGDETRLVVVQRTKNIAFCFICMTLTALMSLRDLWRSRELRDILELLLSVLSVTDDEVYVKRLTWPLAAYERCCGFISSIQG